MKPFVQSVVGAPDTPDGSEACSGGEAVESSRRLGPVTAARLGPLLGHWWAMEGLLVQALEHAGLAAEATRFEALLVAIGAQARPDRAPRRRSLAGGRVRTAGGHAARLLEQSRATRAEVTNLRDLFNEWERDDLVSLASWALELHDDLERVLTAPPAALTPEVRFVPGVKRGPLTSAGRPP